MITKYRISGAQDAIDGGGNKIKIPIPSNTALQLKGPSIPIGITHSKKVIEKMQKDGTPINAPYSCNALIDTGAFGCVITQKVADQLGLLQTGFKHITSVNNVEQRPVYFGTLLLPWGRIVEVSFACCDLQGFDCLIGRDVMRHWHMTYDGVNGEITICD